MTHTQTNTTAQKGKHLSHDERVLIAYLKNKQRLSNRAIARELGRAPQTIHNELKKGIVTVIKQRQHHRGKQYDYYQTEYSPEAGQSAYDKARQRSGRPYKWLQSLAFLDYLDTELLIKRRSPDSIIGTARSKSLFPNKDIPCTKSVYNWIDQGFLMTTNMDLVFKLKRQTKTHKNRQNKTILGQSIEIRPTEVNARETFGRWEIDTIAGIKAGHDSALLTLTERKTRFEIIQKIESKTAEAVHRAVDTLKQQCGGYFSSLFQTITSDNGTEFSTLSDQLKGHVEVYFAHPYSSWERGTNEHHNGMIRHYIPKGTKLRAVSREHIKRVENWMNQLPRKILGYKTPKEAFIEECAHLLNV